MERNGAAQHEDSVSVTCVSAGVLRNKERVVVMKVTAPKELLLLTDVLSQHGALPPIETYLQERIQTFVHEYIARGKEVLGKAAETGRSTKKEERR